MLWKTCASGFRFDFHRELIIGWDAITRFGFYLGGKEGGIYTREELKNELCQQNNHCTPYMVTAKKTVLKPHSQIICISDLAGGKLPSNIDCFLAPAMDYLLVSIFMRSSPEQMI